MSGKKWPELLKHLNFLSLSIPFGIITLSILFPMRPFIQQAFIGVLLVWFGVEAMTGFPVWR